jgi:hypothetical protein
MGPAQPSGPGVDLDGMRARPMRDEAPRGKSKGKGVDQGWFERMRTSITSDYGFQQGRKKPSVAPKKPEFSFLEIFYRHVVDKNGQERKLTMKERFQRGYQMGRWMADTALGKASALGQRLLNRGKYAAEPFDPLPAGDLEMNAEEDAKKFEEQVKQKEEKAHAQDEEPKAKDESFWKRDDDRGPGSSASTDRVRVYPTQQDTSRQVGSERVGPERQVVRNDGPWPLGRPSPRETAERKSLPAPEATKTKDAPATPDKSKGEAASDRGRAAAHDLHERKAEAKSAKRKNTKDRGSER